MGKQFCGRETALGDQFFLEPILSQTLHLVRKIGPFAHHAGKGLCSILTVASCLVNFSCSFCSAKKHIKALLHDRVKSQCPEKIEKVFFDEVAGLCHLLPPGH